MRFVRGVFLAAGIYGLLLCGSLMFAEGLINTMTPPALTHPEYFYGFLSIMAMFQILFLLIAKDPQRYRSLMPLAMTEKWAYMLVLALLFALQRLPASVLIFGLIDALLGVLFLVAFLKLPARTLSEQPVL
uniref:Uncharacterized protein n=1 Tax=Thermosporothrix sp. COM3 TaxID=2490863 RepID=A0A455SBZ0_9CHLR|nr:hypothetical protein KTC_07340 [Thermosporothrix sp. COM3]